MTSERQREANRRNALKSTGPRTEAGKAHSRANAIRHGLAAQLPNSDQFQQLSYSEKFQQLIDDLADEGSDRLLLGHHRRQVAEAIAEVRRIEAVKSWVFGQTDWTDTPPPPTFAEAMKCMRLFEMTMRKSMRIKIAAAKVAIDSATMADRKLAASKLTWPIYAAGRLKAELRKVDKDEFHYFAWGLKELATLNRYHDRALARLRSALRDLEAATDDAEDGAATFLRRTKPISDEISNA